MFDDPEKEALMRQAVPYIVTLCAYQRTCLCGEVVEGVMQWGHYGQVAAACWRALGRYHAAVSLDAFILMLGMAYARDDEAPRESPERC